MRKSLPVKWSTPPPVGNDRTFPNRKAHNPFAYGRYRTRRIAADASGYGQAAVRLCPSSPFVYNLIPNPQPIFDTFAPAAAAGWTSPAPKVRREAGSGCPGEEMPEKRILLVEDEPTVHELLAHVLYAEGYAVDVAATVAEAWQLLDAHTYALVIADWRLPDGDGTVIAEAAADLGAKTFVMSGYLFQVPGGRVERHGMLMKPIRPRELIAAVERSIGSAERL